MSKRFDKPYKNSLVMSRSREFELTIPGYEKMTMPKPLQSQPRYIPGSALAFVLFDGSRPYKGKLHIGKCAPFRAILYKHACHAT
ncbi:MAG: hypothetical protein ACP5JH_05820 [Bacteroidota bacterium]